MNIDEILRIPPMKLVANLRGNNPLLLDKMIYTEHELAKELKDSSVLEYNPKWIKKEMKVNAEKIKKGENKAKQANKQEQEKVNQDNKKTERKGWDIFKDVL